jgi:hypothetical protein
MPHPALKQPVISYDLVAGWGSPKAGLITTLAPSPLANAEPQAPRRGGLRPGVERAYRPVHGCFRRPADHPSDIGKCRRPARLRESRVRGPETPNSCVHQRNSGPPIPLTPGQPLLCPHRLCADQLSSFWVPAKVHNSGSVIGGIHQEKTTGRRQGMAPARGLAVTVFAV